MNKIVILFALLFSANAYSNEIKTIEFMCEWRNGASVASHESASTFVFTSSDLERFVAYKIHQNKLFSKTLKARLWNSNAYRLDRRVDLLLITEYIDGAFQTIVWNTSTGDANRTKSYWLTDNNLYADTFAGSCEFVK